MKKRIFIFITLLFLISSCGRDSITETVAPPNSSESYYLSFQVVCPDGPVIGIGVNIYRNGVNVIEGSTGPDGYFVGSKMFKLTDIVRLELFIPTTKEIIYKSSESGLDSRFFVKNYSDTRIQGGTINLSICYN